jgi:hypothetical protein
MSLMATRASRHLSPIKSEISRNLVAKIGGDALRCIKSIQMQKASLYRIKNGGSGSSRHQSKSTSSATIFIDDYRLGESKSCDPAYI